MAGNSLEPGPQAWPEFCILVGDPNRPQVHHRMQIDDAIAAMISCLEQTGQRPIDAANLFRDKIDSWVRNAG